MHSRSEVPVLILVYFAVAVFLIKLIQRSSTLRNTAVQKRAKKDSQSPNAIERAQIRERGLETKSKLQ